MKTSKIRLGDRHDGPVGFYVYCSVMRAETNITRQTKSTNGEGFNQRTRVFADKHYASSWCSDTNYIFETDRHDLKLVISEYGPERCRRYF